MESFIVNAPIQGTQKSITVLAHETTDGSSFYECVIDSKERVQLRLNHNRKWEKIWGNLVQQEIDLIGEAIQKHEN